MQNMVQRAISRGGSLNPIIIDNSYYPGIGFMNPSIFIDSDGDILVNLRHINYVLYHSENAQKFPGYWGPLAYLHPESDLTLRTVNYICRLDKDLNLINTALVDTSKLDVAPLWDFHGLEDARLVEWDGTLYQVGVRRDTTTNGQGRMEYSTVKLDKTSWSAKEVNRVRVPAPPPDASYCEKNWMPIIDRPYHFVKWTSPTEVVFAKPDGSETTSVIVSNNLEVTPDQRGGSQVIPWDDKYIAITHEVYLFSDYLGRKDGVYRHRLVVWDKEFNLIGASPVSFSFMEARIEFCAGMAKHGDSLLVSFGFQDNAAFILKMPTGLVNDLIAEALYV